MFSSYDKCIIIWKIFEPQSQETYLRTYAPSESLLGAFWIAKDRKFLHITKTYLYNFDPLKPHFYIVKLGFRGYTLFFLFQLKNIDCGYSLEPPRRGGSDEYPQSMF